MFENIVVVAIIIVLFELYRYLCRLWLRRKLEQKKKAKRPRKPIVLKPKSERDCQFCQEEKGKRRAVEPDLAEPWNMRKGCGGRKKRFSTQGYFCSNPCCDYYHIADEKIHALVANGKHGTQEEIQDLKCQACGKNFTARRDTILYRLRTHSPLVEKNVWLLALGVDASALEEVFGVRGITIRTWLCRSGMQGKKLHELFLIELELVHVQLDELWANVKCGSQDLWLWVAIDVRAGVFPGWERSI